MIGRKRGAGREVKKVFESKIRPEWVEIFYSKPQGKRSENEVQTFVTSGCGLTLPYQGKEDFALGIVAKIMDCSE